ncbi:MAG: RNA 2',3'-cyclic phosphodiesterase [Candidatus Micrarchaeaceae archaeon]
MEATADAKVRAFIGVDLPEGLKRNIMPYALKLQDCGFRLVSMDNMHITLFFLGDIDKRQQELVSAAMDRQNCEPFRISVAGFGTFLTRHPNPIFAKIKLGRGELLDVHRSLSMELKDMGIKAEKRYYIPHITVTRSRETHIMPDTSDFLTANANIGFGEFVCDSIRLKQSVLTGDAPVYTDIHVKHLKLLRKPLGTSTQ